MTERSSPNIRDITERRMRIVLWGTVAREVSR